MFEEIDDASISGFYDTPDPIYVKFFLGLSLFVWKKPELRAEAMVTEPYKRDGKVPLVMIQVAWFEFMFYNHRIYNYLYKRDRGYLPEVLREQG